MNNIEDLDIIDSVLKGNVNDYSLLIDRYKNKAFSLLIGILKNKEDAEEVLQDSFIKAYNSLASFRKDSKFSTWFYKIVYNTGITAISIKKRKIQMEMKSIDDLHYLIDENEKEEKYLKEYVIKMVDRLPVRNFLVLILFYLDNFQLKEISEVMDLSIPNTKVLLHRSRNILREHNYQEEINER